ncbi:hypothetical protein HGG77_19165 [Vibrio aestuarianus subsp. francensis]|nr:hypothetical protein [Vibrio aestuarianus subsp. francensis]
MQKTSDSDYNPYSYRSKQNKNFDENSTACHNIQFGQYVRVITIYGGDNIQYQIAYLRGTM